MSGDVLYVMIVFGRSTIVSVLIVSSFSSCSQPSSNGSAYCFSNRPVAFERAPRPRALSRSSAQSARSDLVFHFSWGGGGIGQTLIHFRRRGLSRRGDDGATLDHRDPAGNAPQRRRAERPPARPRQGT